MTEQDPSFFCFWIWLFRKNISDVWKNTQINPAPKVSAFHLHVIEVLGNDTFPRVGRGAFRKLSQLFHY